MSRRMVRRFTMAAVITILFVAPVAAQGPRPHDYFPPPPTHIQRPIRLSVGLFASDGTAVEVAPMPRVARRHGELRLGLQFGGPQIIQVQYELRYDDEPAIAPMPREKTHGGMTGLKLRGASAQWNFVSKPTAASPVPGRISGDFEFYVEPVHSGPACSLPVTNAAGCANGPCAPALPCVPASIPAHPMHGIAVARRLSASDSMNFGWQYGPPLAARHAVVRPAGECHVYGVWDGAPCPAAPPVSMPRNVVEIIGEFDARPYAGYGFGPSFGDWAPVFRAAPMMAPPRPLPAPAHPLVAFTAFRSDDHGGWWVEPVRMPQSAPAIQTPPICRLHQGMNLSNASPAAMDGLLSGTWYRDLGNLMIAATFAGNELKLRVSDKSEEHTLHYILTGDYSITRQGMVHGVVTGVDIEVELKEQPQGAEIAGLAAEKARMAHKLANAIDCPFAFRFKQTSSGLMVTNVRIGIEGMGLEDLASASGMYRLAVNGKVPQAQPVAVRTPGLMRCEGPACRTADIITARPSAVQVRQVEYAAPACAPPMPTPMHRMMPPPMPVPQPPMLNPAPPANVPPGEFSMMVEVFGQMVGGQPTPAIAPNPCPTTTRNALLQAGGTSTYLDFPLPAPAMPVPAPGVGAPMPTGTWYRKVGSRLCTVKLYSDHLTMSFVESCELGNGKPATTGISLTADYHLLRDGSTAVGVITSVDGVLEADPTGSVSRELLEAVTQFQKACEEQPFAMKLRVYGDSLVIGSVRMPEVAHLDVQPANLFSGQYRSGKPMETVQTPRSAELTCPVPTAPPGSRTSGNRECDRVRMDELLYQSEGVSKIKDPWRRFWFQSQPAHLTPERIHGGIY